MSVATSTEPVRHRFVTIGHIHFLVPYKRTKLEARKNNYVYFCQDRTFVPVFSYFCADLSNDMKKNIHILLLLLTAFTCLFTACDDEDTYADRREREREQINAFIKNGAQIKSEELNDYILNIPGNIKVISEADFYANDSTTDVSKNEYVLFGGSGVYMQIVRKGSGNKLEHGQSATIVTRYTEFNIARDTIQSTNRTLAYETFPDIMTCSNNYGVFTASFLSGVMKSLYNTASVPSGWIIPLSFINIGRQDTEEGVALVRLIVPSTEGQNDALNNVYPCFYEISYQRGR